MNITDYEIEKILMLAKNGYGNRQMAIELMIKESRLQRIKKEMRDRGITIENLSGRPKKKALIASLADFNRIDQ